MIYLNKCKKFYSPEHYFDTENPEPGKKETFFEGEPEKQSAFVELCDQHEGIYTLLQEFISIKLKDGGKYIFFKYKDGSFQKINTI